MEATTDDTLSLSDSLGEKVDAFLINKMREEHLPGVAIVVVKEGNVIYQKGYGVADVETGKKVDSDSTIFRIGSVSKALTILGLTKLIDQGQISYEDDVTNYFGNIQNPFQLKDTVKFRHILTHTGGFEQFGIRRQILSFDLSLKDRKANRSSILTFAGRNLRRIRPAGSHFTYDTYGATLAGVLIERITGLSYSQAMKELLFEPLGMSLSSVEVEMENMHLLAKRYGYNNGVYTTMPYEVYKTVPASSVDATVADMGRLLEALTSNGSNKNGLLFSEKMMRQVLAPQYRPHPEFVGMTHGFWEGNVFGSRPTAFDVRTLGHGGVMLGTTCNLNIAPELNLGIFIVANRDAEAGGGGVSTWEVFNVIYDHFNIKKAPLFDIPSERDNLDLNEYAGNYYNGLFCHTCGEEAFRKGAWQRGAAIKIEANSASLVKAGLKYIPRGDDVFVRQDGKEMIFFGRNTDNKITFFVSSEDSTSFERIDN
ncbi:MAG: serine hydrolase domain-containing protein [Cyclobacteriaceae bacterium]